MSDAPEGYVPWFFPVQRGGKAPDSNAISLRSKNVCLRCNARWIKKVKKLYVQSVKKAEPAGNHHTHDFLSMKQLKDYKMEEILV